MELDKLLVRIEADLSDLKRGLNKANNEVKKSSNKMSAGFQKFGKTLDNVGGKVLTFGGLFATAFGGIQLKKVIDVGRQIEDLTVRLNALFGSAEEGAKAFKVLLDFAGRVPFQLEEIQSASANLAIVSEDAEELAKNLELTGNVASVTGLDFKTTAEQIQRSLSSGISSADLFRERGVKAMLGFSAGAEVSLAETEKAFERVFGRGGKFGNATEELAKTLTGTLSMLQDKLLVFRKAVASEFNEELKSQLNDANNALQDSQEQIEKFGEDVGKSLANLTRGIVENFETIKDVTTALGLFLAGSLLFKILNSPQFLALGAVILFVKEYNDAMKIMKERFGETEKVITKTADNIGELFLAEQRRQKLVKQFNLAQKEQNEVAKTVIVTQAQLKQIVEELNETFEDAGKSISDAFGDAVVKGENFKDAMKSIFKDVASQIASTIFQILVMQPLIESLTASLKVFQSQQKGGITSGFLSGVGSAIVGGATSMLGFANGGYTPPNKPYMVGERGAEMFVPRTAGNVVANQDLGNNVTVNQSINFSTGVVPTVRAEVLNLLPAIKEETINAVAETRARGGAFARTFGA